MRWIALRSVSDGVKMAVTLFVTVIIATLVIFIARSSSRMHQRQITSAQQMVFHSDQSNLPQYDGSVILGDEVQYVIMKYDGMFMRVVTRRVPEGFTSFSEIKNPNSPTWIDGTAKYVGRVLYSVNGACVGIEFCEEGALADAFLSSSTIQHLEQVRDTLALEVLP